MDLTFIFSEAYDFCKFFEANVIGSSTVRECIDRKELHMSEILAIAIYFHISGYKTFKAYYINHVRQYLRGEFPNLPSYNRFVELKNELCGVSVLFGLSVNQGKTDGIGFVDSFSLEACHLKRAASHKTLKQIAAKGKTSMGWFFGLKLHCVINTSGEICSLSLTPGNVADNNAALLTKLFRKIIGKLFGDKGYLINEKLRCTFKNLGLEIITKVRNNMSRPLYTLPDALILRKRGLVESVGNVLKNSLELEHSRHRSISGFLSHLFSALTAYAFRPKKPSLNLLNLTLP